MDGNKRMSIARKVLNDPSYAQRACEFIRMLPPAHYGEAALTALGVKPVTILPDNPQLDNTQLHSFLQGNTRLMKQAGLFLHGVYTDENKYASLLVNSYSLQLVESSFTDHPGRVNAVAQIFSDKELKKKYAGNFLGYPIEYRPESDIGYTFSWAAFADGVSLASHYIWFAWDHPTAEDTAGGNVVRPQAVQLDTSALADYILGIDYVRAILEACLLVENMRLSANKVRLRVYDRKSDKTLVHKIIDPLNKTIL